MSQLEEAEYDKRHAESLRLRQEEIAEKEFDRAFRLGWEAALDRVADMRVTQNTEIRDFLDLNKLKEECPR